MKSGNNFSRLGRFLHPQWQSDLGNRVPALTNAGGAFALVNGVIAILQQLGRVIQLRAHQEARQFAFRPELSYRTMPVSSVQKARKLVVPSSTGTAEAW